MVQGFFRNSSYIAAAQGIAAGFGLLYWLVAARHYPLETVGLATTIISSHTLIVLLARGGIDHSLTRYLPTGDRPSIFFTSLTTIAVSTVLFSSIWLILAPTLAPEFKDISRQPAFISLFVTLCASTTWNFMLVTTAQAVGKPGLAVAQNLVSGLRFVWAILLAPMGIYGILGALVAASIVSGSVSHIILTRGLLKGAKRYDTAYVRATWTFTTHNYGTEILRFAPALLAPVITLRMLGAEAAALIYIAMSLYSMLNLIPRSIAQAVFIGGSHGHDERLLARRSRKLIYPILTPMAILLMLFAGPLLSIFGPAYTEAHRLVALLAVASFLTAANFVQVAEHRVREHTQSLLSSSATIFLVTTAGTAALIPLLGIESVGVAWIIAYGGATTILRWRARLPPHEEANTCTPQQVE